jgi:hypothetical protein
MIAGLAKLVDKLHFFAGIQRSPGNDLLKSGHVHGAGAGISGQ